MRKIPAVMATQHPDNAYAPFWQPNNPFIGAPSEVKELYVNFSELDVSEYMWDWEGKHADASVVDRLFSNELSFFDKHQIARDNFLTFRIPNIWEEHGYNLMQAMSVMLSAEDMARDLQMEKRPLFEVILPMTTKAEQLLTNQRLYEKLSIFKSHDFTPDEAANDPYLEMIPLMESFEVQMDCKNLLKDYLKLHFDHFGFKPDYIRPFLAGSDSALTGGFLTSIIGNKIAIARLYEFQDETKVKVYPIFGTGSPIFRGGLAPDKIDRYLREYPGIRTATVQSSFRYDHDISVVKKAIKKLKEELPKVKPIQIPKEDQEKLIEIAKIAEKNYQSEINLIVSDVQPVFNAVPRRRDRRQHVGRLSYSRTLGERDLPRAITFTAGFYSLGTPPELIGLGKTLKELNKEQRELLLKYYPSLIDDLKDLMKYVSLPALKRLKEKNQYWQVYESDLKAIKDVYGIEPQKYDKYLMDVDHFVETLQKGSPKEELEKEISSLARLRHTLG